MYLFTELLKWFLILVLLYLIFWQVISVDTNPVSVVQNVPDSLATEIPPSLLLFSDETADISVINKKEWTGSQVSMWPYTQYSYLKTNFQSLILKYSD